MEKIPATPTSSFLQEQNEEEENRNFQTVSSNLVESNSFCLFSKLLMNKNYSIGKEFNDFVEKFKISEKKDGWQEKVFIFFSLRN